MHISLQAVELEVKWCLEAGCPDSNLFVCRESVVARENVSGGMGGK